MQIGDGLNIAYAMPHIKYFWRSLEKVNLFDTLGISFINCKENMGRDLALSFGGRTKFCLVMHCRPTLSEIELFITK